MRTRSNRHREAFTLIELMVAIAIIAILAGLIGVASNAAWTSAKRAKAKTEISQLDAALEAFKLQYVAKPPSRIVLCENADEWVTEPRSVAIIRTLWPQFDFNLHRDINRNVVMGEKISLDAAECLVFFLGGTVDDGASLNGFSKNPANPWERNTQGSRIRFFEFDLSRLIDDDADGIFAYQDAFRAGDPIVYYSDYDGYYFDVADLCWGMTSFYRPAPPPATPTALTKPYSYSGSQIVAPGPDGVLGSGGVFSPDAPANQRFGTPAETLIRQVNEADNLTNFHPGMLSR